jgi:hypothetical protein
VGGGSRKRNVARLTSASEENGHDLVDLEYWMDGWERKIEKKEEEGEKKDKEERSSPNDSRKICVLQ